MRRLIPTLILALILFQSVVAQRAPSSARALASGIERILDDPKYGNAFWGVHIEEANSGAVLYSRNADKSMVPASNMKLYTTAAGLDLMHPDETLPTDLYAMGEIDDGVLIGNLVAKGSGDPSFGGELYEEERLLPFQRWADSLRAHGIRRIEGSVIGDDNVLDDLSLGLGWSWDDEIWWYSAEMGGLVLHENCVDFDVIPRKVGEPAVISWEPINTNYVTVENASMTVSPDSTLDEEYARPRGTNNIRIGTLVPYGDPEEECITVSNPTLFFAHVLREVLVDAGISVSGSAMDVDDLPFALDYENAKRIARHESVPLSVITSEINKRSQNLYADQLLKILGARFSDEPGSHKNGVEAAMSTFAKAGMDTSILIMNDGSGLSRINFVTPRMSAQLLRYMYRHEDGEVTNAFIASLPIGGVDGSLENRFRRGAARGNVRAKTGFVSNVRTLSGYVTTAGGTDIIFSLMANHYTIKTREVNRTQDQIVNLLARYTR